MGRRGPKDGRGRRWNGTSAQTSGMAGFYSNLLTRNIAAGADVEKAAVSSYTHGSRRNAFVDEGAVIVVPQQEEDAAASALARFETPCRRRPRTSAKRGRPSPRRGAATPSPSDWPRSRTRK